MLLHFHSACLEIGKVFQFLIHMFSQPFQNFFMKYSRVKSSYKFEREIKFLVISHFMEVNGKECQLLPNGQLDDLEALDYYLLNFHNFIFIRKFHLWFSEIPDKYSTYESWQNGTKYRDHFFHLWFLRIIWSFSHYKSRDNADLRVGHFW